MNGDESHQWGNKLMTEPISFELFMRNYQDMVFTTAIRLLGREADAEDISQEVFLKAYAFFDALRDNPAAGGWLKTVTRNQCLNHLSRYRSRWQFFSEMFSHEDDDREFPSSVDFAKQMEDSDRKKLIHQALMKLPVSQRVPLVLFHYEGLSYEEIARQLKISLSKAKTDIHRGREALREKLTRIRGELESDGFPGRPVERSGPPHTELATTDFLPFIRNELRA
jgi:RNA polymerase sigma-70 factor (ECF subfamily)